MEDLDLNRYAKLKDLERKLNDFKEKVRNLPKVFFKNPIQKIPIVSKENKTDKITMDISNGVGLFDLILECQERISKIDSSEIKKYSDYLINRDKVVLYYVFFDVEIIGSTVLLGFYFPLLNHYHTTIFDTSLSVKEFNENRCDLIDAVGLFINPIDIYYTDFFKEKTKLSDNHLNKLRDSIKIHTTNNIQGLTAGFLSLPNDNLTKQEVLCDLDKLCSPLLITFNGSKYDLNILGEILFYNCKSSKSFASIERSIDCENPNSCINSCLKLSNNIISSAFDFTNIYSLPYDIVVNLLHFDIYSFYKNYSGSNNLYFNKVKLYLKNQLENSNPLKNFIPIELQSLEEPIDYSKIKYTDFVNLYNFNDLWYTYQMFLNSPTIFDHIRARFMFYENFKLIKPNFAFALNAPDSNLGSKYINEYLSPYISVTKSKKLDNQTLKLSDLIFVNNYPNAMPLYEQAFGKSTYGEASTINISAQTVDILGCTLTLSFGGIHSKGIITNLNQSDVSTPIVKSGLYISSTEYIIIDLDVASFYVAIILKIFKKVGETEKYEFFKKLSDLRLKLKAEKNSLQLVYKIIILAVTGQFNMNSSIVYDPVMYYSMTANGQLIILEILKRLEKKDFILQLLSCNTDGFTVVVSREKLDQFKEFIKEFEREVEVDFDTFDEIKSVLYFNVNTYIINYQKEGKTKIKGFQDGHFEFVPKVISSILTNLKTNNIDLNTLWEHFSSVYDGLTNKSYPLTPELLGYRSYAKQKKVFYFSSEPDSFAGIATGDRRSLWKDVPFPIKEFNIQKEFNEFSIESSFKNKERFDLSYFDQFIEQFFKNIKLSKSSYFKFLLLELQNSNVYTKSFDINDFNDKNRSLFLETIKNDYPAYKSFQYLYMTGACPIPKKADKKSFKNPIQKNRDGFREYAEDCLNLKNMGLISQNLKGPILFYYTAAVAIHLPSSFPHVVVLDLDDISNLYNKQKPITKGVFELMQSCFLQDCLIISGPTKQQPDRFKLVFNLSNINSEIKDYNTLKLSLKPILDSCCLPFKLEEQASLVGFNKNPFDLYPLYKRISSNKSLISIQYDDLLNYLNDKNTVEHELLIPLLEQLLIKRFISPIYFEKSLESDKTMKEFVENRELKFYDENFLKLLKTNVQNVFKEGQNLSNSDLLKSFFTSESFLFTWVEKTYKFENTNRSKFSTIFTQLKPQTFENFKGIKQEPQINQKEFNEFIKQSLDVKNYSIKFNELKNLKSKKLIWSEPLINFINTFINSLVVTHGMNFKLKEIKFLDDKGAESTKTADDFANPNLNLDFGLIPENTEIRQFLFVSNCVVKTSDPNPAAVGLIIKNLLKVYITCFHQSCKDSGFYKKIENDINSRFNLEYMIYDSTPFEKTQFDISKIFYIENNNIETIDAKIDSEESN